MLSRRNVRVKVMQILFALSRDKELTYKEAVSIYKQRIASSYELYLFTMYIISRIVEVSTDDKKKRSSKHLPSDYDKAFTDKFKNNVIVSDLLGKTPMFKEFKKFKFEESIDQDICRKIYFEFSKEEAYKTYIMSEEDTIEAHLALLLEFYRFLRKNELFNELLEDNYINVHDDKSLVIGAVKKTFKALPTKDAKFYEQFLPEDETIKDFGELLLQYAYDNDQELVDQIDPVLENWDQDRVAVIDMILMKMALSELLNFQTIPTKVTINEYVEVSKVYSTPKSKEFINGVLDKLLTKLEGEGKVKKSGRGLVK